jgi:hypothetical protein
VILSEFGGFVPNLRMTLHDLRSAVITARGSSSLASVARRLLM